MKGGDHMHTDSTFRLPAIFGEDVYHSETVLRPSSVLGKDFEGTHLVNVVLEHGTFDATRFIDVANGHQSRFEFGLSLECPAANLFITETPMDTLYVLDTSRGVTVSAEQCDLVARCVGLSSNEFLLLCSLPGLIQLRCLEVNPLLIPEDLRHRAPSTCLFALKQSKTQFLLNSEVPTLCTSCRAFYRCTGLELETGELIQFLGAIC